MTRAPIIALLFFAACGDAAAPAAEADASDVDPSRPDAATPWIYPGDDEDITPALDAATLQSAVQVAMGAALELEPDVVLRLHELLFPAPETGSGDPLGCPFFLTYDYDNATAFYWQGECTAADGTTFSGSGSVALYDNFINEAGVFDGFDVQLAGRIEAADGTSLEGSGRAGAYDGTAGDLRVASATLDGTFVAAGPRAPASPWLDGSRKPSLTVTTFTYVPTGGKSVSVVGGLGGLAFPSGVSAVSLDELTARQALAGATCERELGGGAGVRGADGNWYDVYFDGALGEQAQTPAALCDGCGVTWFRGVDVGPTCVDARPFFAMLP